ncbi:hypothetical protein ACFQFQ_31410 [Sulfitobacter porphyrae]|uniref:Uncharacterized protein n=1 Tax=Sulfitobacter porphyrae TaxID=1246864 RepID=A0ABW2BCD8_9RHOB
MKKQIKAAVAALSISVIGTGVMADSVNVTLSGESVRSLVAAGRRDRPGCEG